MADSSVTIELNGIDLNTEEGFFPREREVLEDHGTELQLMAKEMWRGWAYGRQYSPPRRYRGKPGTSRDGWEMHVTGNKDGQLLVLENRATDPRRVQMYAGHVHRVGKKGIPAWHEVLAGTLDSLPDLREALADAVIESLTSGAERKKLRPNQTSQAVFHELVD